MCSTIWATHQPLLLFKLFFSDRVLLFVLAGLGPTYGFLSSWDDRYMSELNKMETHSLFACAGHYPQTTILLISASWVAGSTGVSHHTQFSFGFFFETVLLCSAGWPWTHNLSALASQVLGLQVGTTTSDNNKHLLSLTVTFLLLLLIFIA
jgi:hypothetical protein